MYELLMENYSLELELLLSERQINTCSINADLFLHTVRETYASHCNSIKTQNVVYDRF